MVDQENDPEEMVRRKRHGMLKMYYGIDESKSNESNTGDPCDINGPSFDPDLYLNLLIKERSLSELMDEEHRMIKQIKAQDSQMQTLVYDNYNKFISATDTIRKMKNDFKKMEEEMDLLATNMNSITEFSSCISNTLQQRRQHIMKLSGVHSLLKKLQFLFELPSRLNKCLEMESYSQAVSYYEKAKKILHQYEHMPSFRGIHNDCAEIITNLVQTLRERLKDKEATSKQVNECVDLLRQLNEPADVLCEQVLSHARYKLDEDLTELDKCVGAEITSNSPTLVRSPVDILEFMDLGCNGFLSDICLVIASYNDMFVNCVHPDGADVDELATRQLVIFVNEFMERYFNLIEKRVKLERETGDNTILVRALDRFHRRLQSMNKLIPDTDFSRAGIDIVSRAAHDRVNHYLQSLKLHFTDCLTDVRQGLVTPRLVSKTETTVNLMSSVNTIKTAIVDQVKSVLSNLQAFISPDLTFAMKPYFLKPFCSTGIRDGLVLSYFSHIINVCEDFCETTGSRASTPPALLLILSRLCLEMENSQVSYLLTLTEERFLLGDQPSELPLSKICSDIKAAAQHLLDCYVKVQGLSISQMLRKSVETRDWLNTIEPRNVRAVMKRVVEDITSIDSLVSELYEEGTRTDRSNCSDSSRRAHGAPSIQRRAHHYAPSLDNSLMSNIQKLFSERIEIFTAVEFSKVSILTGIIKISLKTFLECVRLRTFGRYGLQQIQVDTHYLQLYLWRFISDENLMQVLLDEIVCSTVHRCVDPTMMEPTIISLICERG